MLATASALQSPPVPSTKAWRWRRLPIGDALGRMSNALPEKPFFGNTPPAATSAKRKARVSPPLPNVLIAPN
jgi:hypothetical protein